MKKILFLILIILTLLLSACTEINQDEVDAEAEILAEEDGIPLEEAQNIAGQAFRYTQSKVTYVSCSDSDNGLNYELKGTAETPYVYRGRTKTKTVSDSCTGNTLTEYYCNRGRLAVRKYTCPDICKDGACVVEAKKMDNCPTTAVGKCVHYDESSNHSFPAAGYCTPRSYLYYDCYLETTAGLCKCSEGCYEGACFDLSCNTHADCQPHEELACYWDTCQEIWCGDGRCRAGIEDDSDSEYYCSKDCVRPHPADEICGNQLCRVGYEDNPDSEYYCPSDCQIGDMVCGDLVCAKTIENNPNSTYYCPNDCPT